jgi:hypothetical protein
MLMAGLRRVVARRAYSALCLLLSGVLLHAAGVPSKEDSGAGLTVLVPAGEADVLQAVNLVSSDQVIHGTYVYEKEKTLTGAHKVSASSAFKGVQEPGTTFYKVADNVIDPRHFKDSNDIGAITVRYIVQGAGPSSTSLRIDAVFLQSGRHHPHRSDGTVESAEYDAVNQQLQEIQAKRAEEQEDARKLAERKREPPEEPNAASVDEHARVASSDAATDSSDELERRVDKLRHQVEVRARTDGVPLKSAPFRRASTLESLRAHAEVVVLIVTPYWYGVETADQHHGWIRRSELEPLP